MASENSVMAVIRASRPTFRNSHDKIAFAIHATFLADGFSLIAVGRRAFADDISIDEDVGIEGWNEMDDAYGFVYSISEKGTKKTILVKCLPLEDYLMVDAVNLNNKHKEPFHLQIHAKDYLADIADQQTNYGEMYKDLQSLVKSLNKAILDQVNSNGKVVASTLQSVSPGLRANQEPVDGYPVHNEPMPSGLVYPPITPYGNNDLYPGPGAGFYPERGSNMGGGMLVGPNDPLFFGRGVRPDDFGRLPGVPPGARFDPYGPPDIPGFEPMRFVRQPPQPGSGTHPDLEHFQGSDYI